MSDIKPSFPRGPGPLVSVLLPTRGRPEKLAKSIDSLVSLAENPQGIEILLKVDDDDLPTLAAVQEMSLLFPLQVMASPRRNGYADMHHWYNQLAAAAQGDWLLLWNDDAIVETEKWDRCLALSYLAPHQWHGVPDVACLVPTIKNDPGCTAFFFLRRKVVQLLGRLSAIPHCDTWAASMMQSIHSLLFMPRITVAHQQERDTVFLEGEPDRTTSIYTMHNYQGIVDKLKDAIKLQEYIIQQQGKA